MTKTSNFKDRNRLISLLHGETLYKVEGIRRGRKLNSKLLEKIIEIRDSRSKNVTGFNKSNYYYSSVHKTAFYFTDEEWQILEDYRNMLNLEITASNKLFHVTENFAKTSNAAITKFLKIPSFYKKLLNLCFRIKNESAEDKCNFTQKVIFRCLELSLYKEFRSELIDFESETSIDYFELLQTLGEILTQTLFIRCYNEMLFLTNIHDFLKTLQEFNCLTPDLEDISLINLPKDNKFAKIPISMILNVAKVPDEEGYQQVKKMLCLFILEKAFELYTTNVENEWGQKLKPYFSLVWGEDLSRVKIKQLFKNAKISYFHYLADSLMKVYFEERLLKVLDPVKQSATRFYSTRVTFEDKQLTIIPKMTLPKLMKITRTESLDHEFSKRDYLITLHNYIPQNHDNYYISSQIKDSNVLSDIFDNTKFCLNFSHLTEFFSVLKNCMTLCIDELIKNDLLLKFIGHIYKINFLALKDDKNFSKRYFENLITYAINFNDFKKLPIPKEYRIDYDPLTKKPIIDINKQHVSRYNIIIKTLNNKMRSLKIMLNEIFNQIYLMCFCENFSFQWFVDGRNRIYFVSSALNVQQFPIVRSFLSFYNPMTLAELHQQLALYSDTEKLAYYDEIKKCLLTKIQQILPNYSPHDLTKLSLMDLLRCEIKIGSLFECFVCVADFVGFSKVPQCLTYRFKGTYSLDASCSGAQNLAFLLQSRIIAYYGQLIIAPFPLGDLYTCYIDFQTGMFNRIKDMLVIIGHNAPELRDNLMQIYKKQPKKMQNQMITPAMQKNYYIDALRKLYHDENFLKEILIIAEIMKDFEYLNSTLFKSIIASKCFNEFTWILFTRTSLSLLRCLILDEQLRYTPLYSILGLRNLYKSLLMTDPYGSTEYGKQLQLITAATKIALRMGLFIDNKFIRKLKALAPFISKTVTHWLTIAIPPFNKMSRVTKDFCQKRIWKSESIESDFFYFEYKPYIKEKFRINLPGLKIGKTNKEGRLTFEKITREIDYKKIYMSLPANLVQFSDATLIMIVLKNLKTFKSVNIYTIHDCYFIEPIFAPLLPMLIKQAYMDLYEMDLFARNFKVQFPEFFEQLRIMPGSEDHFLPNELNNPNFLK